MHELYEMLTYVACMHVICDIVYERFINQCIKKKRVDAE